MRHISDCNIVNLYIFLVISSILVDLIGIFHLRKYVELPIKSIVKQIAITLIIVGILSFVIYKYCGTSMGQFVGWIGVIGAAVLLTRSVLGIFAVQKLLKRISN